MDDPGRAVAAIKAVLAVPECSVNDSDLGGTADIIGHLYSAVQDVKAAIRDFGDVAVYSDPNRMDSLAENVRSLTLQLQPRGYPTRAEEIYRLVSDASSRRRALAPDLKAIR